MNNKRKCNVIAFYTLASALVLSVSLCTVSCAGDESKYPTPDTVIRITGPVGNAMGDNEFSFEELFPDAIDDEPSPATDAPDTSAEPGDESASDEETLPSDVNIGNSGIDEDDWYPKDTNGNNIWV